VKNAVLTTSKPIKCNLRAVKPNPKSASGESTFVLYLRFRNWLLFAADDQTDKRQDCDPLITRIP
jgi:hypothetical protein